MGYYVGDIPAEPLVLVPTRQGDGMDLSTFTGAEVVLRDFDWNTITAGLTATVDQDDEQIVIHWPSTSPFASAGLFSITVTLTGPSVRERLAPEHLVVQGDDGWHTIDTARREWEQAPEDDARLYTLLEVAKNDVITYAPTLAEDARPPQHYLLGQLMHTRDLWNAGKVDPASGGFGEDTFVLTPRPLDWIVKQILHPKTRVPVIG